MTSYQAGMIMGAVIAVGGIFMVSIVAFAIMIRHAEEINPPPLEDDWGKDLGVVRSVYRGDDGWLYEKFTSTHDNQVSTRIRRLRDQDDRSL